jgi:PAS domain S-box-containing protein
MADVKILLVEDESIEALDIKRTLESFGYEVPYVASSGEEAVEKALKIMPDLILMDLILKGEIDGIETITKIKDLNIPVIYLTAHSEESTIERAKLTEPYGYIIKPYDRTELKYAIELAIYKNQMEKELKESYNREHFLADIIRDASVSIGIGYPDGKLGFVNKAFEKLTGYSEEELKNINWNVELTPEKWRLTEQKCLDELQHSKKSVQYEKEYIKKDGSIVPIELIVNPHLDSKGNIEHYFSFLTNITERKEAEEALQDSEKSYRELVDNSLVGVYRTNLQGDILFINDAMAKIYHYDSKEEMKENNIISLYKNKDDRIKLINKLKKEGKVNDYELETIGKNVKTVNVLISANLEEDVLSGMFMDITDLKLSEKKFRVLINNSTDLIRILDKKGIIIYDSPSSERILGYPEGSLIGKSPLEFIHPEDLERVKNDLAEVYENRNPEIPTEFRIRKADGEYLHVESISQNMINVPNIEGIVVTTHPIQQRKEMEDTLRESEEKYRTLFESDPDYTILVSGDGVIRDFNLAAEQIIGISKDELIGKHFMEIGIFPEDELGLLEEKFSHLLKHGDVAPFETRIMDKNRKIRFGETSLTIIKKDNVPEYILVIFNDITKRKKAEKELLESEGLLRGLFDNMPSGMGVYQVKNDGSKGSDYIIKEFNHTSQEIEGMTREEVIGKSLYDIRPNIDEYGLIPIFKKVWETGEPIHYPSKIYVDEEYANWYENYVFKATSGEVVAIYNDVTEQEKSKEVLKESEEKFRTVANYNYDWEYWISPDGNLLYVSPSCERITGYLPDEFIKEPTLLEKIIHPHENEIREHLKNESKGQKSHDVIEYRIITKQGKQRWIAHGCQPVYNNEGEFIGRRASNREITKRKKAESELIESKEFLENIVENIPNTIFIKNADKLIFEMVNKAAEDLFGKTDYDFFPKNEADFFTQKDREVLENKKLLDIPEETIETKNLGQRILHTKKIPIFNKEGNPQYLLGISEDITELKKAEKARIKSEERYRTLYSSMNEGLAIHEVLYDDNNIPVDYEIIDVNHAYEEILGIKRKEVLEKKASELYGTGKAPYLEVYSKVAQTGNPDYFETYFEPMDKYFRISVFSPSKGNFATVFEDITDRKKSELKLKVSEERFRMLFELNNAIMLLIEPDSGNIVDANPAASKFYGYPLETLRAMNIDHINQLTPEEIAQALEQAQKEDQKYFIFPHKLADSKIRTVEVFSSPIIFGEENILFSIINDITSRIHNEEEIKKSLVEKENLLREIHHRVKNNMQIISSLLHLESSKVFDKRDAEFFTTVQDRIKSMGLIHGNLYQSEDLSSIKFKEYVDNLTYQLFITHEASSNIKLVTDIMDITLNMETAIPTGLIVNELVSNSLKYAFPESEGEISISIHSKGEEFELIIKDNGVGIPKDVNINKPKGLGLELVNSLVGQLEGTIELDRSHGTEFKITFKELKYKERI